MESILGRHVIAQIGLLTSGNKTDVCEARKLLTIMDRPARGVLDDLYSTCHIKVERLLPDNGFLEETRTKNPSHKGSLTCQKVLYPKYCFGGISTINKKNTVSQEAAEAHYITAYR